MAVCAKVARNAGGHLALARCQRHQHPLRACRQRSLGGAAARDGRHARELGRHLPRAERALPDAALRPARLRRESRRCAQQFSIETLVDDLAAVLAGTALAPPYHFVTVAAATMQALIYMTPASGSHCEPRVLQSVHRRRSEPHRPARRARRPRRARRHARRHPGHARQFVAARRSATAPLTRAIAAAISGMIRSASAPTTGRSRAAT